jgi:hypothetical protein
MTVVHPSETAIPLQIVCRKLPGPTYSPGTGRILEEFCSKGKVFHLCIAISKAARQADGCLFKMGAS